jgi:phosphoenolpyruvate-protein kinase (PTS system EI component)
MHGGLIQADGTMGRMPVDLDLAADLGRQARALGLTGLVQHGASTLSLADLARLPAANVVEVHLATKVQNIVFDHPAFPADLLERMRERLLLSARGAEGEQVVEIDSSSEAQRFYRARWTAWGLFRTELLALPEAALSPITESFSAWVADIFQVLRAEGLADRVRAYAAEEK